MITCTFYLQGRNKTYSGESVNDCVNKFKKNYSEVINEVHQFVIYDLLGKGSIHPVLGSPFDKKNKAWLETNKERANV